MDGYQQSHKGALSTMKLHTSNDK